MAIEKTTMTAEEMRLLACRLSDRGRSRLLTDDRPELARDLRLAGAVMCMLLKDDEAAAAIREGGSATVVFGDNGGR